MVKTDPAQESCASSGQALLGVPLFPQAAHVCIRPKMPGYQCVSQPFCERKLEGMLPPQWQPHPGGSALPWLCSRRPRPALRCGQSVLLAVLPLPAGQVGRQEVLGDSGCLSREAAVNGNCLVENNQSFVTGAYFSNGNMVTWKSLGAQG